MDETRILFVDSLNGFPQINFFSGNFTFVKKCFFFKFIVIVIDQHFFYIRPKIILRKSLFSYTTISIKLLKHTENTAV